VVDLVEVLMEIIKLEELQYLVRVMLVEMQIIMRLQNILVLVVVVLVHLVEIHLLELLE
jgi:hypothetical protein